MYKSPIELSHREIVREANKYMDERIFEAIYKCDIHVDRDELLKALSYDRMQYEQGYEDGEADAQKWISVKDRLPEEEKEVLCYLGNALGKGIVVAFRRHGDWYFDGWKCPTVTHWMPLPQLPKEECK